MLPMLPRERASATTVYHTMAGGMVGLSSTGTGMVFVTGEGRDHGRRASRLKLESGKEDNESNKKEGKGWEERR